MYLKCCTRTENGVMVVCRAEENVRLSPVPFPFSFWEVPVHVVGFISYLFDWFAVMMASMPAPSLLLQRTTVLH